MSSSNKRRPNVVFFGATGAGKSSVINLVSGLDHDVARTSDGVSPCTMDTRPYDVAIQGREFCLFDTVGLVDPQAIRDSDYLIGAISKAYRLVRYLTSDERAIDLLVFCVRGDRVIAEMRHNYLLLHDFLCYKKIPIVLVVTHLEHQERMEDWWLWNHSRLKGSGIQVVGHACIASKREFGDRYHTSRQSVHGLLLAHTCASGVGFTQENVSGVTEPIQKSPKLVGLRPHLDSGRVRARKLREYGLREDEIATLLVKICAVDADMDMARPLHSRGNRSILPKTRTRTTRATVDETPNVVVERCFPSDLTNQVTREVHEPVASGGFADIYKGVLRTNAESIGVAIKAIKTFSGEDDGLAKKQKRLHREISVWLNLKHDNVLPLLGITMGFGQFPAMVCPWAGNGTLTSYLGNWYASLEALQLLHLLNDVASGLQYLHSRSIVHGDLSGSNILIRESGRAYIADFGLSTLLTELGGLTFATSFRDRGTIRWMAPELLDLGNEPEEELSVLPTTQSDVYSFGSVMLQILSGKVPYYYHTRDMQVVLAVSKGITPTRPSGALVTERRWAFIQRCWSTVDITRTRPLGEEIIDFTKNELANVSSS